MYTAGTVDRNNINYQLFVIKELNHVSLSLIIFIYIHQQQQSGQASSNRIQDMYSYTPNGHETYIVRGRSCYLVGHVTTNSSLVFLPVSLSPE